MGWGSRLKTMWRNLTLEDFKSIDQGHGGLLSLPVASGVTVNQETANSVAAYRNGIVVIAGYIGMLDRYLYKRVGDNDRERATGHPVNRVIHESPNPYMTPMVFWETITSHAVGWGNGYAEIEWDNSLRPIGLWPITPDKIRPACEIVTVNGRKKSKVFYIYNGATRIEAEDILHIPGLGFDGLCGYSPVHLHRQALGLAIAAEGYGAAYYGNGATVGVALEHPKSLSPGAAQNLRDSFNSMHQGVDKAHRLLILEEGMKASKPFTIPQDDAQFLETRQFQIEEIGRILNISPHKLKHGFGKWPGGTPEWGQIDFMTDTLLPWATKIEQECNRKLISDAQRGTYYVEHLFQKILKADVKTRSEVQKTYFDLGVLDAEQIAQQENLPKPKPKPEPEAPAPPVAPARAPEPVPEPEPEEPDEAEGEAARARVQAAQGALLVDVVGRYGRREAERALRAAQKGPERFQAWVEEFYQAGETETFREFLEPAVGVAMAHGGSTGDAGVVCRDLAAAYLARSRAALLSLPAKDLPGAVAKIVADWEASRAQAMAEEIAARIAAEERPYEA